MSIKKVIIGQLVVSVAGRDFGHYYMVVGYGKTGLILLADGRSRKIANPKVKNIRHVTVLKSIASGMADVESGSFRIADEDIRQAISTLPDNL